MNKSDNDSHQCSTMTSCIRDWLLTIVWDYSPGHGRCVYSPNHPEHAEPTEVLATLLLGQKFRIVGKHDGNWATNPAKIRNQLSPELNCVEDPDIERRTQSLGCQHFSKKIRGEFIYFILNILKHYYSTCMKLIWQTWCDTMSEQISSNSSTATKHFTSGATTAWISDL